ncbi:MAG: DUF4743 domain-containing protein [Alphaproteobacteria bacterium]|nr:DUF4743 domain-containing protein [Alphaproteobacteria bacterium]
MSYLRHIEDHNRVDWRRFRLLTVGDAVVGHLRDDFAPVLDRFPEVFRVADDGVTLNPALRGFEDRTEAVRDVCTALVAEGVLPDFHGERYGAFASPDGPCFFAMDRRHVIPFGMLGAGVHLNGIVGTGPARRMWIARRSRNKATFPGLLDNLVAGGKPFDEGATAVMIRECQEEAGIPEDLAASAVPVSAITYAMEQPTGLRHDCIWSYDLVLPEDFRPTPEDGEVEDFMLMPLDEVARIVRETDEFKFNCNLVIIDYLIRTGFITPDDPDYVRLSTGLRAW